MPTFIKTGFWEKLSKAPKEYLNLEQLILSIIPTTTTTTTSPPYKMFVATLSQSGTSAPVINEIFNNLGVTVTSSYISVGLYAISFSNSLPSNKTTILLNYVDSNGQTVSSTFSVGGYSYSILTRNTIGVSSNDILYNTVIEIKVFN